MNKLEVFIMSILVIFAGALIVFSFRYPYIWLFVICAFYAIFAYSQNIKLKKFNYYMILNEKKLPERLVFVKVKTTGPDYRKKDKIVEVGIATFENMKLVDTYIQLVNPGVEISSQSIKTHGITNDMVKDMPPVKDIISQVYERVKDQVVVGYDVDYDIKFLQAELHNNNFRLKKCRVFDVRRFVKKTIPSGKMKDRRINTVADYLEIPIDTSGVIGHCRATFDIFKGCLHLRKEEEQQLQTLKSERLAKMSELERNYIRELLHQLKTQNIEDRLDYEPESDGVINFKYGYAQIGKIRFREGEYKMQLLDNDYLFWSWVDIKSYDEALKNQRHWVRYCQYLCSR